MFRYPLAITLILLALLGKYIDQDKRVYASVTGFTLVAALFDLVNSLPAGVFALINGEAIMSFGSLLPFASLGMGWIVPAFVGLVLGLVLKTVKKAA
ncbi:MAG: branched-chain amino acid transport system II carrier protein [Firmicutes bacterium]|nr:branched-chain amino acid transport system II carrier protein [Bacillota bacterium]